MATRRSPAKTLATRTRSHERLLAGLTLALAVEERFHEKVARLARVMVPALADCVVVDVVTQNGVERACTVVDDPRRLDFVRDLERRQTGSPPPIDAIRTSTTSFVRTVTDSHRERMTDDPGQLEVLRRFGPRSYVTIPVRAGGVCFAAFTFSFSTSERRYLSADVARLEELVELIAFPVFALHALEAARHGGRPSDVVPRHRKTSRPPRSREGR